MSNVELFAFKTEESPGGLRVVYTIFLIVNNTGYYRDYINPEFDLLEWKHLHNTWKDLLGKTRGRIMRRDFCK